MLGYMCVSTYRRATTLSLAKLRAGGPQSWFRAKFYCQTLFISSLIKKFPPCDFFSFISYLKHKDKGGVGELWSIKKIMKELLLFSYFP